MTAAAMNAAASRRKRKPSPEDDPAPGPGPGPANKKKSPLFDRPQNFYAPPDVGSMNRDQLSAWRKERRRRRNRESAAACRNKTRARIEELEGELAGWRDGCAALEGRMRVMERQIAALTERMAAPRPAAVVSRPVSPPGSPARGDAHSFSAPNVVASDLPPPPAYSAHFFDARAANPFPALLSEPEDCASPEEQDAAAAAAAEPSPEPKRTHLNPISRQA